MKNFEFLKIAQVSTGFIEVPNHISLCVYTQGCKRQCKDCHNPTLWSFDGGEKVLEIEAELLINEHPMCDYVVYLGGEPLDQLQGLIAFSKEFKKLNKRICLYTGYQFSEIDKELLKYIDIVVDGEFVKEKGPVTSKTTNQKIWLKTVDGNWSLINSWDDLTKITKG